jgi:hypothetical protein
MSHYTINGRPAGYYVEVVAAAAEGYAELVRSGALTEQQALELAATAPTQLDATREALAREGEGAGR